MVMFGRFSKFVKENGSVEYVVWAFLILSSYALLYKFRFLDRNIFFSWIAVSKVANISEVFLLMFLCILVSYAVANSKFELKNKPLIIFLTAFLLEALFWNVPEVNPDASRYFIEAKYIEQYGVISFIKDWGTKLQILTDFPAVPFLYGLIFKFIGESRMYLQILNTVFLASTSVITYLIGRKLWNESAGFYASIFVLSFPYLLAATPLTGVDIPTMFLLAVAVYATLNAVESERSKIWILVSTAFALLTFFAKISAWCMLGVVPAIFIINYIRTGQLQTYRFASILLLSGGFIFIFAFYKINVLLNIFYVIDVFKAGLSDYNESPFSLLFFKVSPLISLMAFLSIYAAFKKKDANYILLAAWFLVPLAILQSTRIRYMIPALPALALMASLTVCEIKNEKSRNFLVSSIAMCSVVLALFFYMPFLYTDSSVNLKNAAEYVNKLGTERVEVYVVFPEDFHFNMNKILIPIFDLHSSKEIVAIDAEPTGHPTEKSVFGNWTWGHKELYGYYSTHPDSENAVVIISLNTPQMPKKLEKRLSEDYRLAKFYSFGDRSSISPYVVIVYIPKLKVSLTSPEGGGVISGKQTIAWKVNNPKNTYEIFSISVSSASINQVKIRLDVNYK